VKQAIWLLLLLLAAVPARGADSPKGLLRPVEQAIGRGQALQRQVEAEQAKIGRLRNELQQQQLRLRWTRLQRDKHRTYLENERAELAGLQQQRDQLQQLSLQLDPWLEEQYRALQAHRQQDLIFLPRERDLRLQRLRQSLDDPAATAADRLRRLLEAWLVEAGYGHSLELREATITLDSQPLAGDLLRIGRLLLLFRTPDGEHLARRLPGGDWQPLGSEWAPAVERALEMASRRRAQELVSLPLAKVQP